jgi:antitoxin component YwqK of YwqJK toxin-antitoxin module
MNLLALNPTVPMAAGFLLCFLPCWVVATERPVLIEIKVEIKQDGLAYLTGSKTPFTGDAIDLHYDRTPPPLAQRTPYLKGLKHGPVTTYTSGGKLRQERTYKNGIPASSIVYHGNGQKKIEVNLNAKDLAEGPYKRWHDNGVLQAESTFDADERFHGEEKDYDREGKLIGHYRHDHGNLIEVIFETPEMKIERLAKMNPSPPVSSPSSPGSSAPQK